MFPEKNKKKILFEKNSFAGAQMPGSRAIPGAHKKGKDLPRNSHIHCSALVIRDLHISSEPVPHIVHSTASWKCKDQNSVPA